jgi:hypothetical protein
MHAHSADMADDEPLQPAAKKAKVTSCSYTKLESAAIKFADAHPDETIVVVRLRGDDVPSSMCSVFRVVHKGVVACCHFVCGIDGRLRFLRFHTPGRRSCPAIADPIVAAYIVASPLQGLTFTGRTRQGLTPRLSSPALWIRS